MAYCQFQLPNLVRLMLPIGDRWTWKGDNESLSPYNLLCVLLLLVLLPDGLEAGTIVVMSTDNALFSFTQNQYLRVTLIFPSWYSSLHMTAKLYFLLSYIFYVSPFLSMLNSRNNNNGIISIINYWTPGRYQAPY